MKKRPLSLIDEAVREKNLYKSTDNSHYVSYYFEDKKKKSLYKTDNRACYARLYRKWRDEGERPIMMIDFDDSGQYSAGFKPLFFKKGYLKKWLSIGRKMGLLKNLVGTYEDILEEKKIRFKINSYTVPSYFFAEICHVRYVWGNAGLVARTIALIEKFNIEPHIAYMLLGEGWGSGHSAINPQAGWFDIIKTNFMNASVSTCDIRHARGFRKFLEKPRAYDKRKINDLNTTEFYAQSHVSKVTNLQPEVKHLPFFLLRNSKVVKYVTSDDLKEVKECAKFLNKLIPKYLKLIKERGKAGAVTCSARDKNCTEIVNAVRHDNNLVQKLKRDIYVYGLAEAREPDLSIAGFYSVPFFDMLKRRYELNIVQEAFGDHAQHRGGIRVGFSRAMRENAIDKCQEILKRIIIKSKKT